MAHAQALLDQVVLELRDVPEEKVVEVLDFVGVLKSRRREKPARGSAEAILPWGGTWQFEPGELENLLKDMEQSREIED